MDLPAAVFASIDLAPPAGGLARGTALSGDVLSVQAVEPVLALSNSPSPGACRVASAGGTDATSARALSERTRITRIRATAANWNCDSGSVGLWNQRGAGLFAGAGPAF